MGLGSVLRDVRNVACVAAAFYVGTQVPRVVEDTLREAVPSVARDSLEHALGMRVYGDIPDTASADYKYLAHVAPLQLERLRAVGDIHVQAVRLSNRHWIQNPPLEQFLELKKKYGMYWPLSQTVHLLATRANFVHEVAHGLSLYTLLVNKELQDSLHAAARGRNGEELYPRGLLAQFLHYGAAQRARAQHALAEESDANFLGLPSPYATTNSFELVAEAIEDIVVSNLKRPHDTWLDSEHSAQGRRIFNALARHGLVEPSYLAARDVLRHPHVYSVDAEGRRLFDNGKGFRALATTFLATYPASPYAEHVRELSEKRAMPFPSMVLAQAPPENAPPLLEAQPFTIVRNVPYSIFSRERETSVLSPNNYAP